MCSSSLFVLGFFVIFLELFGADPEQGFTYKYLGASSRFLELRCQNDDLIPENHVLMIAIYNTTTRVKMAQVVGGLCPTVEDSSRAEHLYLPGCSSSHKRGLTDLKLLIANYDSSTVQTFLCNVTKVDEQGKPVSVVWSVTVDKFGEETTSKEDTSKAGHTWFPDSTIKIITSIEEKVNLLEPAFVVAGVTVCVILFSLAVQTFLSCKIIRILDKKNGPKNLQIGSSHSKISVNNKSATLEEEPFYATM